MADKIALIPREQIVAFADALEKKPELRERYTLDEIREVNRRAASTTRPQR